MVFLFFALGFGGIAAGLYKLHAGILVNEYLGTQGDWVTTPATIPEGMTTYHIIGYSVMIVTSIFLIVLGSCLLDDLIKRH